MISFNLFLKEIRIFSVAATLLVTFFLLPSTSTAISGKLNINTANEDQLKELPFIGNSKAKAIVRYRKKNGPFTSMTELKEIPAIGHQTYEAIRSYLSVSGNSTLETTSDQQVKSFTVFPRIKTSPGQIMLLPDSHYYRTLMSYIQGADTDIFISMFIFKTTNSKKNRPALLLKELTKAAKRGVSVQVTLDNSGYDEGINIENNKVAKILRRNNVKVTLDSKDRTTHAKLVVVDNRYCFIGSHNLTQSALKYNNEYSLLIDNQSLAKELKEYIKAIK